MRFFLAILAAAAALTWVAAAAADDGYVPPPCADTDVATLAPAECTGQEPVPSIAADDGDLPSAASLAAKAAAVEAAMPSPADLPAYCRVHANVYFYTSTDWLRLGQRLQANQSPCAE